MPAVFVHGVPDTAAMWSLLLAELARPDVVTLSLPGFAAPLPDGFGATKEDYVDWIAAQLEMHDEPVDLVGHDWGSLLTQRVALTRPELVRSFTLSNGAVTERFAWHDIALQWQTPEVGEQLMEAFAGELLAAGLASAGHPRAEQAAADIDETMKRCILALYRSATDLPADWSPTGPAPRPALVLWGKDDPVGPPASGQRFAAVTGAPIVLLDGGHWAILEHPKEAAAELQSFWAGL